LLSFDDYRRASLRPRERPYQAKYGDAVGERFAKWVANGADGGMPNGFARESDATSCNEPLGYASMLPTKSQLALQFQKIRQAAATVRPRGRHTLR
jgi:hypothetical protein